MERIRVGISACLLGQAVRYDGGHKRADFLVTGAGDDIEWVPVCPEVEAGLGTPREPMRLVRAGDSLRMITIRTGVDHTDAVARWAEVRADDLARLDLRGYIFKKNSPSCGMQDVPVFTSGGAPDGTGRGLFAELLTRRFPDLPVEEEERLQDPRAREAFFRRVRAFRRSTSHA